MLSNVLPGLRELRAPLAAGYLWLTFVWLTVGDTLPTRTEVKDSPLDRLYELEPVVSDIGKAVVVSVAAYIVGSVAIDAQGLLRRFIPSSKRRRFSRGAVEPLESALADAPEVERWYRPRAEQHIRRQFARRLAELSPRDGAALTELEGFLIGQLEAAFDSQKVLDQNVRRREAGLQPQDIGEGDLELSKLLRGQEMAVWLIDTAFEWLSAGKSDDTLWQIQNIATETLFGLPSIAAPAVTWIDENRGVVKTRLLDLSQALHSEVDRPDAEATFRMGLWPPLAAIGLYLALAQSPWWTLGLVVPIVLAVQWLALRRTANDALVTAIAAKPEARAMLLAGAYRTRQQPPPPPPREGASAPPTPVGPAATP